MDNNNPYNRYFKSKTEQYRDKLKQRSNNQDWLFGNIFGKPGGGAPLRDNKGNIISHLKTINNDNIFKHDPNYFSKGNNNITVLNSNIYNQNNLLLTPNNSKNKQIPIFTPKNQSIPFENKNNINYNLPNNNNSSISLNQRQIPFRYIIPLQNIIPITQASTLQLNNNISNYYKPIATTPSINNNSRMITPSINYINKSQNISKSNINNLNKEEFKIDNSSEINNHNLNENEENNLLISNDNDRYNKIQNEKKLEDWKNDLRKQMEEQKKRKEDAKKREAEEDKEEEIKYREYLAYKSKQAEENKKNKTKWKKNRNQQSQNQSNIEVEKSNNNELEQSQHSKINNIENNEFEDEPYSQNNPLNDYNIPPEMIKEQENLKNYIDNQYNNLEDILNPKIQNEIEKLSLNLTKKYEPFTDVENLSGVYKFNDLTAERNNRKMEKIQDILEERDLLDFITGKDDKAYSTAKYQNYDIKKYYNLSSNMPSYFGKNIMPYEKENKQLNSDGHFIFGDFSNNKKREQNNEIYSISQREVGSRYNEHNYENFHLNNNINRKFGKNKNENLNSQSLEFSQSLDNKTSFIPFENYIDKNSLGEKSVNKIDEDNNRKNINKIQDKVEENIIKGLDEIDKLNKNVILYKNDENFINSKNNEKINNIENNSIRNEIKNNNDNIDEDKNTNEKEE